MSILPGHRYCGCVGGRGLEGLCCGSAALFDSGCLPLSTPVLALALASAARCVRTCVWVLLLLAACGLLVIKLKLMQHHHQKRMVLLVRAAGAAAVLHVVSLGVHPHNYTCQAVHSHCCERPCLCPWHRMAGYYVCRIDVNASLVACLLGDPGSVLGETYMQATDLATLRPLVPALLARARKSSFTSPASHDRPKLLPAAHQPVRGACVEVGAYSAGPLSACARCLRSRHACCHRVVSPRRRTCSCDSKIWVVLCHSYAAWLHPPHPFMLHSYHPRAPFQGVRRSIIATPPRASAFDASSGQTTTTTTTSDSNGIKPELNGGWAGSGC